MNIKEIYNLLYSGKIDEQDVNRINKFLDYKTVYIGNYKLITDITKQLGIKTRVTDEGTCFKVELIN